MPQITSVTIRRFKQLRDVTLNLKDTTILIGSNNSGKSSILQAIHFAVSVAQSAKLVGEGVAWAKDSFELSFNPAQLIYSPIADVMALAYGGHLQEGKADRVEIDLTTSNNGRCVVGLRRGRNRNIAVTIEGRALGEQLMDRAHPFSVYAPGLAGVPKEERFLSPGAVRRIVARGDANLVLRNVLLMLSQRQADWNVFLEDMRSLFKGIDVAVAFDSDTDETIGVSFQLPGGPRLPIDAAGTSILQASQIFAYISLFQPRVLILDEPDSHLHPNNQRALCDLVHRVATGRNFQALISTHSRHVVDVMKNRGALIWLNKGVLVPEADQNTTTLLLDLGALDSADYFADGTLRCVVATEDSDTAPLEALLSSNGFVDDETEIVSYSGCAKIEAAKVLGQFLADKAAHLRLIVHRDRDYMGNARVQAFTQALQSLQIIPFLTDGSDIENYFVNAQHLNYLNPAVTVARVQELIDQATAASRMQSIEFLINLRTAEAFQQRRDGGPNVDHGAIATQALADYDSNPAAYRRGTIVVGRVISALQQELGTNPRVWVASPHLAVPALQAAATQLWPPVATAPTVAPHPVILPPAAPPVAAAHVAVPVALTPPIPAPAEATT